ncbi:MAG: GAF domain-containing sensor histidine kinase [Cyanobacteria bacterium P01_A01_bin.45]
MLGSSNLGFSQTLPIGIFYQFGNSLNQMTQGLTEAALVITEAVLLRIPVPGEWQDKQFTVVVCKGFSALLIGKPQSNQSESKLTENTQNNNLDQEDFILDVQLSFDTDEISSFLEQLQNLFGQDSQTYQDIEDYRQILNPNDPHLQSKFTLLLIDYLLPQASSDIKIENLPYPHVSSCQRVEDALKKQIYQEKLLNQVTTQIRKSLDLSVIMATALARVREFLDLDRLVIYKFQQSNLTNQSSEYNHQQKNNESEQDGGYIVYEVKRTDTIPSVLNHQEKKCFASNSKCWEKYLQGFILAVDDVEKTYRLEKCLLDFLHQVQVRAKLAAPIMFEDKLWGLLIAHQCDAPYNWTESDKSLIASVAEQMAIAIHQAELMRSLTLEKETLEKRVNDRTVELHDALVAAEAANRLRSEFLATISHELLTPLTYVIGMSSTLLRWSFGELSKRQRDYLQTIHDSGEHLLEMINDILDLSQIEAGKAALNISEFSLCDIAQSAIDSIIQKAEAQGINLILDFQIESQKDNFKADARRVKQILWNLLSNAIKFTAENGEVRLRLWIEDNTAVFQVEDTGIGIPQEELPLLFEKFHQLDTSYRRRYGGTGLGLALTKQLIEMHRGRIDVDSSVGIGSIFTVWIPMHQGST